MSFAYWLKYYRNKAGFTQHELAKKLNMTRQNYSRYENEELNAQPTLELLCRLAHLLKTDPNSLIGFQPEIDEMEYAHSQLDNFEEDEKSIYYRFLTHEEEERMNNPYFDNSPKLIITLSKDKFLDFSKTARTQAEIFANANAERYKSDTFRAFINRLIFNDYLEKQNKSVSDAPTSETNKK